MKIIEKALFQIERFSFILWCVSNVPQASSPFKSLCGPAIAFTSTPPPLPLFYVMCEEMLFFQKVRLFYKRTVRGEAHFRGPRNLHGLWNLRVIFILKPPVVFYVLFELKGFLLYCSVFKILLKPLQFPSGSCVSIYSVAPEARVYEWDGLEWMYGIGGSGYQKCLLIYQLLDY